MHFVAALDRVEGMDCVLCLFEGVATGAKRMGRTSLARLERGVEAGRAETTERFGELVKAGMARRVPFLVEVVI